MRRWTLILCLALIAAFLIPLTGCTPTPDSTGTPSQPTTQPSQPTDSPTTPTEPQPQIADVHQLTSTIYVTTVSSSDGRLLTPSLAELNLAITRSDDGQETVSLEMTPIDGMLRYELDFQNAENSFKLQRPDPDNPIYYIEAKVSRKNSTKTDTFEFFVDFETQTLLFRPYIIPAYSYTVASTDPGVDPYAIVEHFIPYLSQLFPPWEGMEETMYPIPERVEQHFAYNLSGTWLDATGQELEQMDFQLVGNLTDKVYASDDLERNLLFVWPENFGYENAEPVSESITLTKQEDGNNFHGIGLLRNTQTNALVPFVFNIFPQDEIVILEMDGKFLVSSTHSDLNASATLSAYTDRLHHYTTQTVDWEMTAFMLAADGTVMGTSTMSIHGYISEHSDIYSYLVLDIDFPEGFRFQASIPGPYGDIAIHAWTDDPNVYNFSGCPYDTVTNGFARGDMLINTEKEYFASAWELGDVRYLVAATDPNATAEEVFAHFWKYLEDNAYTN